MCLDYESDLSFPMPGGQPRVMDLSAEQREEILAAAKIILEKEGDEAKFFSRFSTEWMLLTSEEAEWEFLHHEGLFKVSTMYDTLNITPLKPEEEREALDHHGRYPR